MDFGLPFCSQKKIWNPCWDEPQNPEIPGGFLGFLWEQTPSHHLLEQMALIEIDGLPIINGDFPWQTVKRTRWYLLENFDWFIF